MNDGFKDSFNLPNTFTPVIKVMYRCAKGHEELQEPDADHICGACNYAFKMEPVEKFTPLPTKQKRKKSLKEAVLLSAISKPILTPNKLTERATEGETIKALVALSKKTYTVEHFDHGVMIRSLFEDPEHKIELFLPEEDTWRWLGNWDGETGLFFMKRWQRHLHRTMNAWGVSDYVIKFLEPRGLKTLVMFVEDTKEVFETTLDNLKDGGQWRWWKDGGFDKQCFLTISKWKKKH